MSVHLANLGLEISQRSQKASAELQDAIESLRADIVTIRQQAGSAAGELEAATGGGAPLQRALDQQQQNMHTFRQTIQGLVEGQETIVERLSAGCSQVEEVRSDMRNLSHEANMLAINTAISAAQLGTRGATIGCVARNMQDLSAEVADMSQELAARVTELRELLPLLESSAAKLLTNAEAFGTEIDNIQGKFSALTTQLGEGLSSALAETRPRVIELRQDSRVATKHLGALDKIHPILTRIQHLGVQALLMGSMDDISAAMRGDFSDVGVDAVVATDGDDEALDAGEMLFF